MARHVAIDLSLHLSALARHREEERKAKQYRPDFGLFPVRIFYPIPTWTLVVSGDLLHQPAPLEPHFS